jgi:hypothetical protein
MVVIGAAGVDTDTTDRTTRRAREEPAFSADLGWLGPFPPLLDHSRCALDEQR